MNTPQQDFMIAYQDAIRDAQKIVEEHTIDGENELLPITLMFPHGTQDLAYEIFKKAGRLLGYDQKSNTHKVYQEAQDILNYAAFLLAYMETHK